LFADYLSEEPPDDKENRDIIKMTGFKYQ